MPKLLVVAAVRAELDAISTAADTGSAVLLAGGVGPAAAAAATATTICRAGPFDAVLSVGIGGGFAGVSPIGSVVIADRIVAADLGADSPTGFLSIETLGLGASSIACAPRLVAAARARLAGAVVGPVVTVTTGTGTAARAAWLRQQHGAVAEGMEGFGVATAAIQHNLPVLEVRAVSNLVGDRDRAAWRIGEALAALAAAWAKLVAEPL